MSKELKIFNSFLFGDRTPEKIYALPDDKLRDMANNINYIAPDKEFIFNLQINNAANFKLRYYTRLINSTKVKYINKAINLIENSINSETRFYNLTNCLDHEITPLIQDCFNKIIAVESNHDPMILPLARALSTQFSTNDHPNIKDKHFIYEYLFYSLIHIHLEIQARFYDELDEHLTLDDFKFNYPFEHESVLSPTISRTEKKLEQIDSNSTDEKLQTDKKAQNESNEVFTPIKNDLKPPRKKIHSYNTIVKKPDWFARFEKELHNNHFIDMDYQFRDKHGQKQELAAIYHNLISKNYFVRRTFNPTAEIKDLHIRKFLDNRYNVNLDKQFRSLNNDKEKLYRILDKLPPSLSDIANC